RRTLQPLHSFPTRRSSDLSIVAVQLDPVGASADLIADDARQAVDAVGFFGPLRHAPFGDELRLIASRGDDGFRRREHARTGHDADRKSTRLNSSHRTISYA